MTRGQGEMTIFLFHLPRPVQKKLIIQSQGFLPRNPVCLMSKNRRNQIIPLFWSAFLHHEYNDSWSCNKIVFSQDDLSNFPPFSDWWSILRANLACKNDNWYVSLENPLSWKIWWDWLYMFNIRPSGHLDLLSMLLLKIRRKYVEG